MITNNILQFLEFLRNKGLERGWISLFTISDGSKMVWVDFGDSDGNFVDNVGSDFDEINETEDPTLLALKLFTEMEEKYFALQAV